MRTEVNKVTVNREADYTLLLITSSVCRSVSAPTGFQFIPDLATLDLYFNDSIEYNSYKELVTNTGCQLYLASQYSDESKHPYYSLRLTAKTFLPVVYPRSNLDYTNWIPHIELSLNQDTMNQVYLGTHTFAYKVDINTPLSYPSFFVVPHLEQLTSIQGNTIIWFGTDDDEAPPRPAEDFNGSYKVKYDPNDDQGSLHQMEAIKQILGKGVYDEPTSEGEKEGMQYELYDNEDGSLTFYSSYSNLYIDYKDMGEDGYYGVDTEFNYDLLVLAAMNLNEYGEDTNEYVTFTSKIRGPRCQEIKINLNKEFQNDYYNLRIQLGDYVENFRFTFILGQDHISRVLEDSKILSAHTQSVYNGPAVEYEFRRTATSLIESTYVDDMMTQWNDISETDYLIYLLLDDNLNIPRYHTFLAKLATNLNAFVFITTDPQITMSHPRTIAFTQKVSNISGKLFKYLPELRLLYTQDFLGEVGYYLIETAPEVSKNVNVYDIQEFGCSINRMVSTDSDINIIVRLAAAQFTKRFTFLLHNIISIDNGYASLIHSYIRSVLAVTPLIETAQLSNLTRSGRNTLNIRLDLTIPRLIKDVISLNFTINI